MRLHDLPDFGTGIGRVEVASREMGRARHPCQLFSCHAGPLQILVYCKARSSSAPTLTIPEGVPLIVVGAGCLLDAALLGARTVVWIPRQTTTVQGEGGPALSGQFGEEASVDCVTAKELVRECDVGCPAGLREARTVAGHEVRALSSGGA